jgi:acyl-homoserine-lactone acylase
MRLGTFVLAAALIGSAAFGGEAERFEAEAARVAIVRDDWGIAHVRGKTDADAVFGMAYAQAEDDFARVEANYLAALGRKAEAEGEKAIWEDLRQRLFIDPLALKADYVRSPAWLRALMNSWADGLNYYLATHPQTRPRVLTHFEPWMALSFSEGSIGGDIERVDAKALAAFYGKTKLGMLDTGDREPRGSNGIAIAPRFTQNGHALLLINPHTSFFFRSELQMTSDEGLNAYGAVTWGQFFIYQGFNSRIGWMHTSTGVDSVDEFAETVESRGGRLFYKHGKDWRPLDLKQVAISVRTPGGTVSRNFKVYYTLHGPIVREEKGKWISIALMNKPVAALEQSFLRTKASDYASFLKTARLQANSSNNTIFADAKGNIGFLAPQFVPRRDNRFDYAKPVDGSDPASDWHGLTPLAKLPQAVNPPNGWVMNTNNWPYSAAGPYSPKLKDFPKYLDSYGENPRGVHATQLLSKPGKWTLESLRAAAYDSYLPAFARLIPLLVKAWDQAPAADPLKAKLKDQIAALRGWDYRWSASSVQTSLAVLWGDDLWEKAEKSAKPAGAANYDFIADRIAASEKLAALARASDRLARDFGNWRTPWGQVNRYQRIPGDIDEHHFADAVPSIAVPFTSGRWGSLASFGAKRYPGTKRYYGASGNSFVALVEFGPKVRAIAVSIGGESGDPKSRHFADQSQRYARGDLRPVYFYPEDLKTHTERTYRPGQ